MSLLPFLRQPATVLMGAGVELRAPQRRDHREWAMLRERSRDFLEPWEPSWPQDDLEVSAWRERLRRYGHEARLGTGFAFLIFETTAGRMVGGISIGNIRRGVAQSGQIGYWMSEAHAGRGLMQASMRALVGHSFGALGLHRLEAACIPDNHRSIHVLENAGFRREGLLRSYLRINGSWRDHVLYALIADEYRAAGKRG